MRRTPCLTWKTVKAIGICSNPDCYTGIAQFVDDYSDYEDKRSLPGFPA